MIELFLEIPFELKIIILSCLTMGIIQYFKEENGKSNNQKKTEKRIIIQKEV